jgi:glutamate formiminotransferase
VPCFLYGPERSLPELRRTAFVALKPDTGPATPHPTAGAMAVGARPPLVAFNVWIGATDATATDAPSALSVARTVAAGLRGPSVRTLGLAVGQLAQVSTNLVDPERVTVADVYDAVVAGVASHGCRAVRAELVGLLPRSAAEAVPVRRWAELDLAEDRTIEARMAGAGSAAGSGWTWS